MLLDTISAQFFLFAYKKFLTVESMGQRAFNLQRPLTLPAKALPPAPPEQDQTSGPGVQGSPEPPTKAVVILAFSFSH